LSFLDNLRIRRNRGRKVASMDREATSEDLEALREFARTRVGVEFFVEPETMVTDTTAVAVAADGEWTRRRVGSPQVIRQVAKQLQLPVYDVQIVGYPERMRAYNARLKKNRAQRMLDKEDPP
jgi:predicted GTPase